MDKKWDVLGIGAAAIDDLLFVADYPKEDTKMKVERVERHGGGLVATALVAAHRLGLRAAFAGVLGHDDESKWITADLRREGVDTTPVTVLPDTFPIHAYIIVDSQHHSRTILYNQDSRRLTRDDLPDEATIRATGILMIDDTVNGDITQIAGIAQQFGIPVIADFERSSSLAQATEIDHLIVPEHYAYRATGVNDPLEAAKLLWHEQRHIVVLTSGADGCWYYVGGEGIKHQSAFKVKVVDTTGCGDVFHGAYAAALHCGWDVDRRIKFASAAAALSATHAGGRQGIPDKTQVETLMRTRTE
ncbi:MAG: PfkB family carbohydrate kinase [Anaerolineae bacterium]|nr:PfkB family carbohydrate kinase [Anaerolineae bacterium]